MNLLSASDRVSHSDPLASTTLFKQFLDERRFLHNVTPSTIEWYETAFKALQRTAGQPEPLITKSSLQNFVVALRPTSDAVNRAVNEYVDVGSQLRFGEARR